MLEGHTGQQWRRSWGYTEDVLGELGVPCAPARSEHLETLQRILGIVLNKGHCIRALLATGMRRCVTARRFVRM
jgi:hypothetical protein